MQSFKTEFPPLEREDTVLGPRIGEPGNSKTGIYYVVQEMLAISGKCKDQSPIR